MQSTVSVVSLFEPKADLIFDWMGQKFNNWGQVASILPAFSQPIADLLAQSFLHFLDWHHKFASRLGTGRSA